MAKRQTFGPESLTRAQWDKKHALDPDQHSAAWEAIRTLQLRHIASLKQPEIGHEDLIHMFTPEGLRPFARTLVSDYGMSPVVNYRAKFESLCRLPLVPEGMVYGELVIHVRDGNFCLPFQSASIGVKAIYDDPRSRALVDGIFDWLCRRVEVGRTWGLIGASLKELDECCQNADQVRFLFPALPALLKTGGLGKARVMEEFKQPRFMPSLPFGLRDVIRKVSPAIMKALMLPEHEKWYTPTRLSADPSLLTHTPWYGEDPEGVFQSCKVEKYAIQ